VSSTRSDPRRRVLILIKGLGIGGAERLVSASVGVRDRDSFDYHVAYILPWKDQLVPSIERNEVGVSCVGGRSGLDALTPRRLRSLIKSWAPDLIHAHLPSAGILARVATQIPVVYTEHNVTSSYRQPTRALNRLTYGRNTAVAAVSHAVADSLDGYPGPTPMVVPNGVSAQSSAEAEGVRAELGVDNGEPLFVHVGNIRPHKGHSNLILASARLAESLPRFLVVSIGGEKHTGDLERVRSEAARAGVAERVRFLGRRSDATDFIAAADVVVNPSDFEGMPVALLEALALARPVVATEVGGVPSVIRHEETGLLVPPRDPDALADAMHRAVSDSNASRWGDNGARLIASEHSVEEMTRRYEEIYREVLHG
jgi:glycosyltransferase involved in cell wall biosynthesis